MINLKIVMGLVSDAIEEMGRNFPTIAVAAATVFFKFYN